MSLAYPIIETRKLARAEKIHWLELRRAERDSADLWRPDVHQVLVYRVGGGYVLDTGKLTGRDERVVRATEVSLVDMRRDAPVVVRLEIPSQDAESFEVLVTFACTVTDAIAVVRGGVDAQQALLSHLKAHSRIFESGLDHPLSEINDVRRAVRAQVKAYLTIRPPSVPGMTAEVASVEINSPSALERFEPSDRAESRLVRQERLQSQQAELEYELRRLTADREVWRREEENAAHIDDERQRQRQLELLRYMTARGLLDTSAMKGSPLAEFIRTLDPDRWEAAPEHGRPADTPATGPASSRDDETDGRTASGTGGSPPAGGTPEPDPEPQRVLVGQMPGQVRDGEEVSLIVHVARSAPRRSDTRAVAMRAWRIPADGYDVTIVVHAAAGLVPLGPVQEVVHVPAGADSDPVRFGFRASGVDVRTVEVTAWAGGRYLAKLGFEVSVTDRGPSVEPATRVAAIEEVRPDDGAVTLQVHYADDRYTFQLHNNQCVYDPVMVAVDAGADRILGRALETLRRLAKDASPPAYNSAVAREWLRSAGVSLWSSIVPEAIRDQYLQLHHRIKTFSIATGNDVVPWELLYPMTKTHDSGFLVNQFPVTRTVYNTGRSRRVNIGGARFVRSSRPPANADEEFRSIGRIVSPGREPAIVDDVGDLLGLFADGEAGLTHFSCHATYRDDGSGEAISMRGGEFSPMMLATVRAKETLTANRPLVFINACRSAGAVPHFTQMMGWAQQFLGAGAGAFIGTLWDVRSASAQAFAEEFYRDLVNGGTLGHAALRARRAIIDDMDPTWLAYTVYGDANAVAFQA